MKKKDITYPMLVKITWGRYQGMRGVTTTYPPQNPTEVITKGSIQVTLNDQRQVYIDHSCLKPDYKRMLETERTKHEVEKTSSEFEITRLRSLLAETLHGVKIKANGDEYPALIISPQVAAIINELRSFHHPTSEDTGDDLIEENPDMIHNPGTSEEHTQGELQAYLDKNCPPIYNQEYFTRGYKDFDPPKSLADVQADQENGKEVSPPTKEVVEEAVAEVTSSNQKTKYPPVPARGAVAEQPHGLEIPEPAAPEPPPLTPRDKIMHKMNQRAELVLALGYTKATLMRLKRHNLITDSKVESAILELDRRIHAAEQNLILMAIKINDMDYEL